jgi:integrase
LTKHFEEFESQNLRDGIIPSYQIVKSHFDSFYTAPDDKGKDQRLTFFAFVDKYIEDARTKPNPITKKPLSKNTLKDYVLTRNVLQQFSNEVKRFDFDDIDADWYDDFTKWCNKKGFKDNYKGKHIKTLKTFLNYALENNLTTNRNHQKRTFSVFKEETESIYLNLDELNTMWQMDLSNEPTKELARDLFLIGCFTGLRVSDYNNLKPTSIKVMDGVKMLVVKTQKTKKIQHFLNGSFNDLEPLRVRIENARRFTRKRFHLLKLSSCVSFQPSVTLPLSHPSYNLKGEAYNTKAKLPIT